MAWRSRGIYLFEGEVLSKMPHNLDHQSTRGGIGHFITLKVLDSAAEKAHANSVLVIEDSSWSPQGLYMAFGRLPMSQHFGFHNSSLDLLYPNAIMKATLPHGLVLSRAEGVTIVESFQSTLIVP